jgi:hypothetical protein
MNLLPLFSWAAFATFSLSAANLGTNQIPAEWRAEHRLIDMHQHIDYTKEHLTRDIKIMDAVGLDIGINLSGRTVFIAVFSEKLNSAVIAWDDWYAVVPHGKEYTASPDGNVFQTGDEGPWKGSKVKKLYDKDIKFKFKKPKSK